MKSDVLSDLGVERVESMHWNRTLARQVLEDRAAGTAALPKDVDPELLEKVRQQIKNEVLSPAAKGDDQ